MGLQSGGISRADFVNHRREKGLALLRLAEPGIDPIVKDSLVSNMLIDESQTVRNVDQDVAQPVLPDDSSPQVTKPVRVGRRRRHGNIS